MPAVTEWWVLKARRDAIRKTLWSAQGGKCALCGGVMVIDPLSTRHATIDHIRPKSQGGTNRLENLQLAHLACNQARGDMDIQCVSTARVRLA